MMVYGASAAYAAPGSEGDGISWLGYLFLGFFARSSSVRWCRPPFSCFGMIKGVFSSTPTRCGHN